MKQVWIPAIAMILMLGIVPVSPAIGQTADWRNAERATLAHQTQLTFAERFFKAGESYFSPDDSMIIFQAVEAPDAGETPEEFYGMYVGEVRRDTNGRITGLDNFRRLSPEGSANTCGWFHPTQKGMVIFGSTLGAPSANTPPGYQRGSGRYRWMFPPEMDIVSCDLNQADGTRQTLKVILGNQNGYLAECSYSPDGRHLLYCSLETNQGDLYCLDTKTGVKTSLVSRSGYDGGPFFSPDGKRICFRSDRRGNNLLQLFIAELAFDDRGSVIGIEREFQLMDNEHVNWAPFWHPQGRHLIYATSEMGHENYEVFAIDADPGNLPGSDGTVRYGTRKRRITVASRFDGLPVFDSKGNVMLWTSQRGEDGRSQLWVADLILDFEAGPAENGPETRDEAPSSKNLEVKDPETGLIYLYNPKTHELAVYDPSTHVKREVTDNEEIAKAMRLFGRGGRQE